MSIEAAAILEEVDVEGGHRQSKLPQFNAYRATSIDGLSALPEHWQEKPLKHVVRINMDKLPETTPGDYELEYVDISNVSLIEGMTSTEQYLFEKAPSRARRCVRDGDTIVSTVRTYLKAVANVINPPENLIVSTGFAVLRPTNEIDPGYLYRLAQSQEFVDRVVAYSVGVSYPAINPSDLGAFPIPLPPLSEQRAIALFLDARTAKIDALVKKKVRLIELLQEKRTTPSPRASTPPPR
jgi:type I restriction enzyme S subunit